MTLKIDLSPEREAALNAIAQAQGVSADQWLKRILEERLETIEPPANDKLQSAPFWKTFTRRMHALPAEVFESLPTDGASEHDHYLYGSAKKTS